jgi:hypothetical protein
VNSGTVLEIQLSDSDDRPVPVADVSIDVVVLCGGRERYRFDGGMTDREGHLRASYDMFESTRRENQKVALMDYNTALDDCDPAVVIHVPGMAELRQRQKAVNTWSSDNASSISERVEKSNNGRVQIRDLRVNVVEGTATKVRLICELDKDHQQP